MRVVPTVLDNSRTFVTESGFRFRSGAFIGLGRRTPVKRLWPVTSILVRVSLVHARQREVTNQQNRDRGHEHEDLYSGALRQSFTAENIVQEAAYLRGEGRASFERPYGLAWLLQLVAELREWDDPQAKEMAANLHPLEEH